MAVLCAIGAGNYLQRTTGLLNPAADSTYMLWVREPAAIAVGPAYNTPFAILDDPGVYAQWAGVFTSTGATGTLFEITGAAGVTTVAPLVNQWNHYAWVQEGTTQRFYKNLILIGTRTVSRAGFTVGFDLLGNDSFGPGGMTVAYVRQWQAALSKAELRAERNTRTAIRTAGLWLDTPLETDLLDVSGSGRNWSAVGTTSFVIPPLTAILDTPSSFPYTRTVTQAEFNVTNDVWFQFDIATPTILGGFCDSGGNFSPRMQLYWLVGGILTSTLIFQVNGVGGWWYYLPIGRYYIRYVKTAGGASNFDFTVQFAHSALQSTPVPNGTIVINDDTSPGTSPPWLQFPSTTFTAGGGLVGYAPAIPAGETGDALPNGIALWHDRFLLATEDATLYLALFTKDQAYITSVNTTPPIDATFPCICNDGTKFYVLNRDTNGISTVSETGVVSAVIATLSPLANAQALGVNRAGTIAYWAEGFASPAIHRWDLVTNLALSDLYTIPGLVNGYVALSALNNNPGEILVLSDDTIVTYYRNDDTSQYGLVHLSPDGTLLAEYLTGDSLAVNHIHYAPDNPEAIHVWYYTDSPLGNFGRIGRLDLGTGTLTSFFNSDLFSAGQNLTTGNTQMFGPSASCTMLTIVYSGSGPPPPPVTTTACPPQAWLTPATPGCVAIGELPDNSA